MSLKQKLSFLKWLDPFNYVDLLLARVWPVGEKKNWKDELVYNLSYIGFAFLFAFIIYSLLGFGLGTHSPLVVVVGKSMEPAYYEGDVLVLRGVNESQVSAPEVKLENESLYETPLVEFASPRYYYNSDSALDTNSIEFKNGQIVPISRSGSVVVYFSSYRFEPVIHRVVAKIKAKDGWYALTKGDNSQTNRFIDQDCGKVVPQLNYAERPCISLYAAKVSDLDGKAVFLIPRVGLIKLWLFDYLPKALSGRN
ncbi:MAG: hypothetical protein WC602_02295 [archaeon]